MNGLKFRLATLGLTVLLFVDVSAAQAQASDIASCELHVWPTENYIGVNTGLFSGFGIIGALADGAAHKNRVITVKEHMAEYLGPDIQIGELNKIGVADKLKLAGYRVIIEPATPSEEEAKKDLKVKAKAKAINARLKSGERLSTSTASCYAELVGVNLVYHKAMMYGSNLFATWVFRDYGKAGGTVPKVSKGFVKNPLEQFPPKKPELVEAAQVELRDAYAKDFAEYVQKKVH